MFETLMFSTEEMIYMMRNLKPGEKITLSKAPNGPAYCNICRLPDGTFFNDNASWVVTYAGGGVATWFSENEKDVDKDPSPLGFDLWNWFQKECLLVDDEHVYAHIKPRIEPEQETGNTLAKLKQHIVPVLHEQMHLRFPEYCVAFPEGFEDDVIEDVYESSAWQGKGYFSEDDVSLAIQRVVFDRVWKCYK